MPTSTTVTPFVLTPTTDLASAITAVSQGRTDAGIFVSWALAAAFPVTQAAALMPLMIAGTIDDKDFAAIVAAWSSKREAAIRAEGSAAGALRVQVAKRGGISLYGINVRQPVTLYASQWERLLTYVKADASNPVAALIADANASAFYPETDLLKTDADWLGEVKAGKHPHATYGKGKDKAGKDCLGVTARVARKVAADATAAA